LSNLGKIALVWSNESDVFVKK